MSEPENATELDLLRSMQRRNIGKALTFLIPTMALWWLLFHWLEQHFKVQDDLARVGSLVVVAAGTSLLFRQFGWARRDARETPGVRRLQEAAFERFGSQSRKFWIVAISFLLLSGLVALYFGQASPTPVMSWGMIIMMMIGSRTILWKLPKSMNELAQIRYLTANRMAYLVTVVLCVGGLFLNTCWPSQLSALVILSLLAGMLTHQLSLAVLEARATSA